MWSTSLAPRRLAAIIITAALFTPGCATITTGTVQSVTLNTDPPGAVCTLTREGETIAVANPTPQSITLKKDNDPITVACKKDGFLDNVGTVSSEFQGMTLGNVLFGGLIGVAIDAGTGAANEYPEAVTFTLIPEVFETTEARDTFFDIMRGELVTESTKVIKRIEVWCRHADATACENQLQAAESAQTAKLAEIETKRSLAKVKNP